MSLKFTNAQNPAAVVAGLDLNGLGVIRSLAAANVPVIALDTDFSKATAATRFAKKRRVQGLAGTRFVDGLLELANELSSNPVLFLTREDSVETVSDAQAILANKYKFSMPANDTMRMLMDKARFQITAEQLEFPIPKSVCLSRGSDCNRLSSLNYPCVVKPLTKDKLYEARFKKAYKAESAQDALALWTSMQDVVDQVIVQEWIEGADSDVYFCLQYRHENAAPLSFVGRKMCQWPPLVGGTASCIPSPEVHDQLTDLTNAFFGAVGFVGLGSMEYKRDRRDGQFYMVEPTVGRTDYQEEIATLNGLNLPFAAYCTELGRPIQRPGAIRLPRAWRDSPSYEKARSLGACDPTDEILPVVRIVDAYFRSNDPLPYVLMKLEPVQRRLRRLTMQTS